MLTHYVQEKLTHYPVNADNYRKQIQQHSKAKTPRSLAEGMQLPVCCQCLNPLPAPASKSHRSN